MARGVALPRDSGCRSCRTLSGAATETFPGRDRIRGGAGADRLFGHGGDDRIRARDGGFDVVGCGSGRDVVVADRRDLVGVDCERVRRR